MTDTTPLGADNATYRPKAPKAHVKLVGPDAP